jgi:isoquinoline 1-oxidoreductase beta subunit
VKRRTWLLGTAGVVGGSAALLVGWAALPQRSRLGSSTSWRAEPAQGQSETSRAIALNGWIKVSPDGSVILAMPRSEMGQGVHTALAMLVADELDVPLEQVHLQQAGFDSIYGNVAMLVGSLPFHPLDTEEGRRTTAVKVGEWVVGKVARELGINATGGSSSVADAWEVLRPAAALARAQLVGAASLDWKLPAAEIAVTSGVMAHPSGKKAPYGDFAQRAAATPVSRAALKPREQWRLIGRSQPRIDLPAKVNGRAQFGLDVRLPDMVYAVARMCPMLGGSPQRVDAAAALKLPGVERVVRLGVHAGSTDGVAVVGRSYWHANQGAKALDIAWEAPPAGKLDSAQIMGELEAAARVGKGFEFFSKGDWAALEARAKSANGADEGLKLLEAVYAAPYLAHAAMEPINCTAQVADSPDGRKVMVWVATQVPGIARAVAAKAAGVAENAVTVHVTYLGGGFGRRLEADVVGQAVRVALQTQGRPAQLVWPREEDIRHDFYRPAHVAVMKAVLSAKGEVLGWKVRSAGDAITPRWMGRGLPALAADTPDKTTSEGLFDQPYGIANQSIAHTATRMGVPVGFWRSVGHSHNAFFCEGFVDEMAEAAGKDPFEFRRNMLANAPRHKAVLEMAATKAGWGSALPPGRARGIALHESFNSIVAQVVEVSLKGGQPQVHRVVCAIDCGTAINPDGVAQQMESSVIFALSAALYGRIDIKDGAVAQSNFTDYPVVSMDHAPVVETHILPRAGAPTGVGEPGVPPLAPAVASALRSLGLARQRSLPLTVART